MNNKAKTALIAAANRLRALEDARDFNSPAHQRAEAEYRAAKAEYEASRPLYAGAGPRYVLV